jgi:hypothetical protein
MGLNKFLKSLSVSGRVTLKHPSKGSFKEEIDENQAFLLERADNELMFIV